MFNCALPIVGSLKLMCVSEIRFWLIESDNVSREHWDVFHLSSKSHNALNSSINNEDEIEILNPTYSPDPKDIKTVILESLGIILMSSDEKPFFPEQCFVVCVFSCNPGKWKNNWNNYCSLLGRKYQWMFSNQRIKCKQIYRDSFRSLKKILK